MHLNIMIHCKILNDPCTYFHSKKNKAITEFKYKIICKLLKK